jgi:hypothetical protein
MEAHPPLVEDEVDDAALRAGAGVGDGEDRLAGEAGENRFGA